MFIVAVLNVPDYHFWFQVPSSQAPCSRLVGIQSRYYLHNLLKFYNILRCFQFHFSFCSGSRPSPPAVSQGASCNRGHARRKRRSRKGSAFLKKNILPRGKFFHLFFVFFVFQARGVGNEIPDEERKDFIDIYLEKLKEFQKEGQHPLLKDHGEEIRALFSTVKFFWCLPYMASSRIQFVENP